MNAADVLAAFSDAAHARGLILPNGPIADGKLHRCRVEGARPAKRDGAYVLHLDDHPAGWILNWKDGQGRETWHYSNGNGTTTWTPAEHAESSARRAAREKAAEEERQRAAEAARREAVALFGNARPADPRHPYLVTKGIRAHGVRQRGDELLVPRHDMITGEFVGLQRILPNGDKRNLTGGRVDGTWFIIGRPQAHGTILVGEGFATCAAHEDTGHAAAIAFGSDNLEPAAIELRRQYPLSRIIVLADDDWKKPDNPGLTAAKKAALASDALLAVPTFGDVERTDKDTDFNDLRRLVGADAVRAAIENAVAPSIDWPDIDPALTESARGEVPEFPVGVFPPAWQAWTIKTAEGVGAPVDYVGMGLIACVAGVTGCGVFVEATSSWREPLVVWVANVGHPSMGKTPALAAARYLIDGVESAAKAGDAERQRKHETKAEAAKVAEELWRKDMATAAELKNDPPIKPAAADHTEPFVPTQMVVEDTTIESVVDVGRGNPRGVILWRDEITGWLRNLGRYSGGSDRPFWLERWPASAATVNRKNRPAVHIARLGASIVGGIQPDRLREVLTDDDDGMAARFLYAWPDRPPYKPLQERQGGPDNDALRRLQRIADTAGTAETPRVLELEGAAADLLNDVCADIYAEAADCDGLEAGWLGKGPGYVVRLAGVLCLLAWSETREERPPTTISVDAVRDAAGLWADYLWPMAHATFAAVGQTLADRQARKIVTWIRRTEASTLSVEDVRVRILTRQVDAAGATTLIARLVAGGVLQRAAASPGPKGRGKPPARWEVNPLLIGALLPQRGDSTSA